MSDLLSREVSSGGESARRHLRFTPPALGAIREVHGLLSPDECAALVAFARGGTFRRPRLLVRDRDCLSLHTVDPALSDALMVRLRPYLPEVVRIDGARWRLRRFTHHWRFVRYRAGGHFVPHFDGSKMLPWHEMTAFTVQIYLDDAFTGGTTRFYMDHRPRRGASRTVADGRALDFGPTGPVTHVVRPELGKALIFSQVESTLHDAEPVERGVKHILRGDVLYAALPEDVPLLASSPAPPEQRLWCERTAALRGTRNFVGEVWRCRCGSDDCGARARAGPTTAASALHDERAPAADGRGDTSGPRLILISGKRAAGKDHVAARVAAALRSTGARVHVASLGAINKRAYAARTGVDLERLTTDRAFKEEHRLALVRHHSERNRAEPGWCTSAVLTAARDAGADALLLTDLRTRADLQWFLGLGTAAPTLLRVDATDASRHARGSPADPLRDGLPTEIELDRFTGWTACFDNSDDSPAGARLLDEWIHLTVLPRFLG